MHACMHACTFTYIYVGCEWQMLWADHGRLGLMRTAEFLSAASSEVEVIADAYEHI